MKDSVCEPVELRGMKGRVCESAEPGNKQESVCESGSVLRLRALRARAGGDHAVAQFWTSFGTHWNQIGAVPNHLVQK